MTGDRPRAVPTFSVIIPTFNRAGVLSDAIGSVLAQTADDVELIVVDDGSSDGTRDVLDAYSGRITSIYQRNAGAAAARNRALEAACGRYIAFLDSDDAWAPWTVEMFSRAVREFGSPAAIAGYGVPWDQRQRAGRGEPRFREHANFLRASLSRSAFRGMGALAIRADVMREARGFRTAFLSAEDQDLCLRLGDVGGFIEILSPLLFFQRTNLQHLSRDVASAIAATDLLMDSEQSGTYPGGEALAFVRKGIICAVARRTADMCARAGQPSQAWRLYRRSFGWHLTAGRWRFLFGFPLFVLLRRTKPS